MTLTKARIVEDIQNDLELKASYSQQIIETLIEIIKSTLGSGEDILISGFGKFCIREKNARKGRNPATGEDMILEGRRVVTFNCSAKLKARINDHKND